MSFAQDADGNWGYKVGADAVIPFKSGNISITRLSNITWSGTGEWKDQNHSTKIDVTDFDYLIIGKCIFDFGHSSNTVTITIKYEDGTVIYTKTSVYTSEDKSGFVIDVKKHTGVTISFYTNFAGGVAISGVLGIN